MHLFPFKSNNHFVGSSDGAILKVYELTKPSNHLSSVKKADWKEVAIIVTSGLEDEDDDDVDAKGMSYYNGLLFFDGHGTIEGEEAIATLAKHLKELHLLVSPEGYCFQQLFDLGVYSDYGIQYIRWNDLFSWPRHGVDLATTNVWSRLELKYNLPRKKNTPKQPDLGDHVGVSKEMYAKLEALVTEKEEELEKLEEKIEEANGKELQNLKKAYEDQQKQVEKKDEELQMLKKMKDDDDEAKAQRIEELEKLNKAKDEEIHIAEAKARNAEGELQEVKEKLSLGAADVAQVNKELEQCRNLSWAIQPCTKFLPQSSDGKDKHLTRRQRFGPEMFTYGAHVSFPYVSNSPKLVDNMYTWSRNRVKLVDEEPSSTWPAPLPLLIRLGNGTVQDFDKNDWWYVKTTHPEGGLTMLVYYDGRHTQLSLGYPSGTIVPLPCSKGVEFMTFTYILSLFDMPPLGVRLGFTYRAL